MRVGFAGFEVVHSPDFDASATQSRRLTILVMVSTGLDAILRDGVILTREALAMGISEKQLRHMVRTGVLIRIAHGAYADTQVWSRSGAETRHWLRGSAILRRYGSHVAMSHVTAVVGHRAPTWGLSLEEVHLTHRHGGGRREAGICHHRGHCADDELVMIGNQQVTGATRTALDIVATNTTEVSVAVVSHFLHVKATTKSCLGVSNGQRREWPGTLATPIALSLADQRLESVGESRCWFLFWRSRLPMPVPQHDVFGSAGEHLGRVDFAWPDWGIGVEFDGKEKYLKYRRPGESIVDAVLREKRRESRIVEATGWIIIRLDWADLAYPEEIERRILDALARRRRS